MPDEHDRVAAGPALLAKRFGFNLSDDSRPISIENGTWIASKPATPASLEIMRTTRIGISNAKELTWRWYLKNSRSISKRVKGDPTPHHSLAWKPAPLNKS